MWEKINDKRNLPPDRRPINPEGPNVRDGEYMPWTEGVPAPPAVSPTALPAAPVAQSDSSADQQAIETVFKEMT